MISKEIIYYINLCKWICIHKKKTCRFQKKKMHKTKLTNLHCQGQKTVRVQYNKIHNGLLENFKNKSKRKLAEMTKWWRTTIISYFAWACRSNGMDLDELASFLGSTSVQVQNSWLFISYLECFTVLRQILPVLHTQSRQPQSRQLATCLLGKEERCFLAFNMARQKEWKMKNLHMKSKKKTHS